MIQAKIDYHKKAICDEFYSPSVAVEMILPFIPSKMTRVWECTAVKESKIVKVLRENGYSVIATHIENGYDYLKFEPADFDICISNPPYSIKDKFLRRAFDIGKPFMFLLPISTLEGVYRSELFQKYPIQLIIPDRRFSFIPGKDFGNWFQTSWFTWGLNLEKDLNFISVQGNNLTKKQNQISLPNFTILKDACQAA